MTGALVADLLHGSDVAAAGIDACTLNNALNVAQLVALLVIVKWLRAPTSS